MAPRVKIQFFSRTLRSTPHQFQLLPAPPVLGATGENAANSSEGGEQAGEQGQETKIPTLDLALTWMTLS